MDNKLIESLKGKSREERAAFFDKNKTELMDNALEMVNGGTYNPSPGENPKSECPYLLSWFTSPGFVCEGRILC